MGSTASTNVHISILELWWGEKVKEEGEEMGRRRRGRKREDPA